MFSNSQWTFVFVQYCTSGGREDSPKGSEIAGEEVAWCTAMASNSSAVRTISLASDETVCQPNIPGDPCLKKEILYWKLLDKYI